MKNLLPQREHVFRRCCEFQTSVCARNGKENMVVENEHEVIESCLCVMQISLSAFVQQAFQIPVLLLTILELCHLNHLLKAHLFQPRSEERRVGKECRSRW